MLKKIVALTLAVAAAAAVLEAVLFIRYRSLRESAYYRKVQETFVFGEDGSPFTWLRRPHITNPTGSPGVTESVNNLSMRRTTDVSETPPDGTVRVLSYGDSIGFGYEVNDEEAYPQVLERMLNENGPRRFEILNMFRGHSPSTYAVHLKRDLPRLKPRAVLMEIELTNDLSDEALCRYGGVDARGLPARITRARYWPGWISFPPIPRDANLWERSNLRIAWQILQRRFAYVRERFWPNPVFSDRADTTYYNVGFDRPEITDKKLAAAFDRMFGVLRAQQKLCEDSGAEFLLVIMPSKFMFYENRYRAGSIRLVERAEEEARRRGIPYISLSQDMRDNGGAELYRDGIHPTPRGYEVIARRLYAYFAEPRLLLPSRSEGII